MPASPLSDAQAQRLIKLYDGAEKEILSEINRLLLKDPASESYSRLLLDLPEAWPVVLVVHCLSYEISPLIRHQVAICDCEKMIMRFGLQRPVRPALLCTCLSPPALS